MADFELPASPEYISEIRKFEASDPAHADLFNAVFQAVINNLEYLRLRENVKVGSVGTELEKGEILFVVEDDSLAVAFSNVTLSENAPETENWAMIETYSSETLSETAQSESCKLLEGNLAVSEEEPTDATFFANIE